MLRRAWPLPAAVIALCLLTIGSQAASGGGPIAKPRWLSAVVITEYWPAPERWFHGKLVSAPGLAGKHRVDWLYSGNGLSMQGDGIGLDGVEYHIQAVGDQGWVDERGRRTVAGSGGWTRGFPFWRGVGWRDRHGFVTYPLEGGGWYHGSPKRYIEPSGITFEPGPSKGLVPWRSVAVDPSLIPMGSRIFAPALCDTPGHGWVTAADTGGAIIGRHLDLFRPAPATPDVGSDVWHDERIWVLPPEAKVPKHLPGCEGPVIGRG
jgi:3D (Asp-Asp-Asp) domain-containing protein